MKCLKCIDLERDGRDPRQAWPDYDAHVKRDHIQHYAGQIGSEATPAGFLAALWECTREWIRVLKPEGSLFVNLGDKYAGSGGDGNSGLLTPKYKGNVEAAPPSRGNTYGMRPKSLLGLPWRYALGCVDQLGLILRAEIIWSKPNGLPESVTDRVRRSHEQLFHFTRLPRYYSAVDEIREPYEPDYAARKVKYGNNPRVTSDWGPSTRNDRNDKGSMGFGGDKLNPLGKLPGSVWPVPSAPLTVPAALGIDHFAAFPPALVRPVVLGWSPPGVCTACGQGRRPVSSAVRTLDGVPRDDLPAFADPKAPLRMPGGVGHWRFGTDRRLTGYACACPDTTAPTRPSVVLDPFGGTGTTSLVASVHGRLGVSVDLSHDYSRLAKWRTRDPGERARALDVPKPPPVADGQGSLFDDLDGVAG